MDNRCGVYTLEFPTGIYVGSSVHMRRRVLRHIADMKRGQHCNRMLQRAFDKYGEPTYRVEAVCDEPTILVAEQEAINRLHPRFNLSPTAGRNLGHRHSPETLARMRAASKAAWEKRPRAVGAEQRERISKALKGRQFSPEVRAKISAAKRGQRHTAETRAKVSASKLGRKIKQRGHAMTPEILAKIAGTKARNKDVNP